MWRDRSNEWAWSSTAIWIFEDDKARSFLYYDMMTAVKQVDLAERPTKENAAKLLLCELMKVILHSHERPTVATPCMWPVLSFGKLTERFSLSILVITILDNKYHSQLNWIQLKNFFELRSNNQRSIEGVFIFDSSFIHGKFDMVSLMPGQLVC